MSSIDYDKIRTDASTEVETELQGISDPFQRRIKAEELRDQANMELSVLRPERDQLLASAALADGKVTPALAANLGVAYSYAMKIAAAHNGATLAPHARWWAGANLEAARSHNTLWQRPDVHDEAVTVAVRYEAAEARRDAALAHLEAAQEAVRTAGGRMKVGALERPDFDKVREQAVTELRKEFATLAVAPDERLRRAAQAADQAEEETAALLPERDAALNSLAFYTTARGVYDSAGITRQGMVRVQQRALGLPRDAKVPTRAEQPAAARAAGVKYLKEAAEELPDIARSMEAARARHAAAVEIRDAAMLVLAAEPYSWTPDQIAEAIDRDAKVVRRVVDPEVNADRRWGTKRPKP
ncbi:hypothetical protein OHS33_39050 (plasmid) [Streptomyces sp. NBC_00536]|uniref:hypothetical protein n=1 Tax=Streptomyces sp. NBC_00536 TaxID=2975769 RepID=UPI002E8081AD|nr:hypothetical protein [Streptomyces sp. NBC_00536]WUC84357.1 hypothetical protein OHS33_39050 [Streptomyces sp. NBC_00536]